MVRAEYRGDDMKIILGAIKEFNDDALIMARQLGADGFHFNTPPIATSDEQYWTESP